MPHHRGAHHVRPLLEVRPVLDHPPDDLVVVHAVLGEERPGRQRPPLGMTDRTHAFCAATCVTTALTDSGGGHTKPILYSLYLLAKVLIPELSGRASMSRTCPRGCWSRWQSGRRRIARTSSAASRSSLHRWTSHQCPTSSLENSFAS